MPNPSPFPLSADHPSLRVLTFEERDTLQDAQHTIAVRARLLWFVLETQARPNVEATYDELLHEGLLDLVSDIAAAAEQLETLAKP